MRSGRRCFLVLMVSGLLITACSSDGGGSSGDTATSASSTTTSVEATTTTAAAPATADSVVTAACDGLLESPETVTVAVPPLVEASGIAVSRTNDGVIWAHNDSGDTARVFALGDDGAHLGTFRVADAEAIDWEDMALGPAVDESGQPVDDADSLYLADIGDNDAVRQNVSLYRVPEPEVAVDGDTVARATLEGAERYSFQYPDGPRDAEALFIDRTTDSFYVIEKSLRGGPVGVYRGPLAGWNADAAVMPQLERVGTYRPGRSIASSVTAADMTPAGDALVVRTYGAVHLFDRPAGAEIAEVLAATPCSGPVPIEAQGEAVAFLPDGSAYLTLPEGASPTLARWGP